MLAKFVAPVLPVSRSVRSTCPVETCVIRIAGPGPPGPPVDS